MLKRVFIAINPEPEIKEKLFQIQKNWPDLPCKWVVKENLHLTLAFLGNMNEKEIKKIDLNQLKGKFNVLLNQICYGADKKIPPRLIWIEGKSPRLRRFRKELDKIMLEKTNIKIGSMFTPHITLGKIKRSEWRMIEPDERPDVNLNFPIEFSVSSIEIMESELKRTGAKYTILKSFNL